MRIEKGHFVVGPEADGRTTPDDLGLARLIKKEGDFIGRRSLLRPGLAASNRRQLVGLLPVNAGQTIPRGAMLVRAAKLSPPCAMEGLVASTCFSPTLGQSIALALVTRGRERMGERLWATSPLAGVEIEVRIVEPVLVDPAGEWLRG